MTQVPLSKIKIETKIATIREAIAEMEVLGKLSKKEFTTKTPNYAMADYFLRRALEATFDICGHILSRFTYSPGRRPATYKELAKAMGEKKIVSSDFANGSLFKMAGYRNRMIHFYDEVTPSELFEIVTKNLDDLEFFVKEVIKVFKNPKKYNLTIAE